MWILFLYVLMGVGVVVDGGYLVNGLWNWFLGCDYVSWMFVGGLVIKDGWLVDFGSFLILCSEYEIKDVWYVVGLCGIGSNILVVKDVFVFWYWFLLYKVMNDYIVGGLVINSVFVYKMLWGIMYFIMILVLIVGMVYGVYVVYVEY